VGTMFVVTQFSPLDSFTGHVAFNFVSKGSVEVYLAPNSGLTSWFKC
jgi:hypothetical protein